MSLPLSSTQARRREWVEWGGVGLLPFLPFLKNWGSRIEGGVRNRRISNSSLDSGEFNLYSCEDLGCGHVQAKSQKRCSPPKGVRTGQKKLSFTSSFLSMPAHCYRRTDHKKRRPRQFYSERLRQMTRSIDRQPERKPRTINLLERLSQFVSVHC